MSRAALVAGVLGFAGLAAALRVPALDNRVVHGDEAVHFYKFNQLWTGAGYRYDPDEYHGPTLYYAALPVAWWRGAEDWRGLTAADFRLVTAVAGVLLVVTPLLLADGLGRGGALLAAGLLALSTPLVFYSRYYIQETLLALFVLAAIGCGWRWWGNRRIGWALAAGALLGAAHATKETFALSAAAGFPALAVAAWRGRGMRWWSAAVGRGAALGGLAAVVVSVAAYSQGFSAWDGPLDSLRTYAIWFERADGESVHAHPPGWYLRRLAWTRLAPGPWWSEGTVLLTAGLGAVLLAARGGARAAPRGGGGPRSTEIPTGSTRDGLVLFVACYAVGLLAIYSAIPYKTPWCAVQFVAPLCLLGGWGAAAGLAALRGPGRFAGLVAVAGLLLAQGWQGWRAAYRFQGDDRNPWVYAHPTRGVERLAAYVEKLAATPADAPPLIQVFAENSWPLPWYLRGRERVGYWADMGVALGGAIVICVGAEPFAGEGLLAEGYVVSRYGLRRDTPMRIYVRDDLRAGFVESQR